VTGATVNVAGTPASIAVVGGVMVTDGEETVTSMVTLWAPALAVTVAVLGAVSVTRASPLASVTDDPGDSCPAVVEKTTFTP